MKPWEKYQSAGPWQKYQSAPVQSAPVAEAPKASIPDGVTFLGSEKLGSFMAGLFPRSAAGAVARERGDKDAPNYLQQIGQGTADYYSAAGRAISSGVGEVAEKVGLADEKTVGERMSDTEGGNFVDRIIRDPGTGAALVAAPVAASAGGLVKGAQALGKFGKLAGLGTVGAVEGAASAAAHQADNVGQGKGVDLKGAAAEVGLSSVLGPAGAGLGKVVAKGAQGVNKLIGGLAEELSGVSEEALRSYGTGFSKGAKEIRDSAGKQKEVGAKILDAIDNMDEMMTGDKKAVNESLSRMGKVSTDNLKNVLEKAKVAAEDFASEADETLNKKLDDLIGRLPDEMDATAFRKRRARFDAMIGDAFGKESGEYVTVLKKARSQMQSDLVNTAEKAGETQFAESMRSMHEKFDVVDDLKRSLGAKDKTRESRIESFVSNLFGKNKEARQEMVQKLGDIFGEDFLKEAKLIRIAAQLGPEGKPSWLPRQFTGRSILQAAGGGGVGYLVGGGEGAAIGAGLGSPRLATLGLRAMDRTGQGVRIASPYLNRLQHPVRSGLRYRASEETEGSK